MASGEVNSGTPAGKAGELATSRSEAHSLIAILREKYRALFSAQWPAWLGGLLVGLLNVFMFAYYRPWGTFDGMRNWGDWLFKSLGLSQRDIFSPLLNSTSVINIGIVLGSATSAMLAKQFAIRVGPARELLKGLVGGIFMGIGANLAFSCNIGGFVSALSALSLSGLGMMLGLMMGAYIGLRYILWEVARAPLESDPAAERRRSRKRPAAWRRNVQPYVGLALLILLVTVSIFYDRLGYAERGGLFLLGIALGLVNQRSRLCLVRAFREPFFTGDGEMTRAAILALAVSLWGFVILKWTGLRPADEFVFPSFFLGSFMGGVVFGIGMVLAGGCGAGSLWRAGEGNVQLWMALLGFSLAASIFGSFLEESGLRPRLGSAVFLPDLLGWKLALCAVLAVLAVWYLLVTWNEAKGKFALAAK